MSGEADWLVSPSKARIARAQAQDWQFVDAFLSKKYNGRRPPTFERNEEILEALLVLATLCDHADEQRNAVEKLGRSALQALTREPSGDEVYKIINHRLSADGTASLQMLAQAIVVLDLPLGGQPVDLAAAAISLQHQQFEASQLADRLARQVEMQQIDTTRLQAILRDLSDDTVHTDDDLPGKTIEWAKHAKHLKAKIGEYEERYTAIRPQSSATNVVDLAKHSDALLRQQQVHKEVCTELDTFQGLPSNISDARKAVEAARDELRKLTRERDQLFENLPLYFGTCVSSGVAAGASVVLILPLLPVPHQSEIDQLGTREPQKNASDDGPIPRDLRDHSSTAQSAAQKNQAAVTPNFNTTALYSAPIKPMLLRDHSPPSIAPSKSNTGAAILRFLSAFSHNPEVNNFGSENKSQVIRCQHHTGQPIIL
ncbi:hypothetical protein B0A48_06869 [Cryoendolithus antarcticus]|uniref:Uncharacterized protein n=1 Tax=Cryoendolithus antarcticus TaxID=1507870 RepID=A0A1V8T9K0_9PEZI|nr:hypothetical protein B0A48_06869 [Cryoendolithus antarcticus]